MKRKETIIVLIILLVVLTGLVLLVFIGNIPKNPAGTIGNTAGNLNNNGLFCEDDGVVYFANAYDNGTLYSMNSDESGMKKLSSAIITSINSGGNYLYYYQNDSSTTSDIGNFFRYFGLYRCKKNGKDATCLKKNPISTFVLIDDFLYYPILSDNNRNSLTKMGTDKSDEEKVLDFEINPHSVNNGVIYYNGIEDDHYLYSLDVATNQVTELYQGNLWNPIFQDNYIYYMNLDDNYSLCRYDLLSNTVQVLSTDRVDYFNVCDEYVYYQTCDANAAIKRVRIDGSEDEIIKTGVFENISITSQYVYFNGFDAPTPVYKVRTYGDALVETFDAAQDAALKE